MTFEKSRGSIPLADPRTSVGPDDPRLPVIVIAMSSFLVTFDITAVIVAMPRIKSDLNLDVSGFAWVMDAYSLAFTMMLMAAGVLADRYGRRKALLVGNLIFCLASLVCGLSTNAAVLWTARAAQGLGAAFVICGGLALLSQRYPERSQRMKAFALAGTISGAAMAFGPSAGGIVTDLVGWRWVFLINVPICIFLAISVPRVIEESRDPTQRRVDLAGLATLTLTLLSLIWVLLHGASVGTVRVPWYVAALIPLVLGAAFILTQRYQAAPLIDVELFTTPAFLAMCVVPLSLSIAYWSLLVYLPLFLQQGLGQDLKLVSWLMLVATAPMLLLPTLGAKVAVRMTTRTFFTAGLAVVGSGCLVITYGALTSNLLAALVGMVLCGTGTAVVNAQVSGAIVAMAPKERAGAVSAIATILRQGGFAAGIAVLGALLARNEGSAHNNDAADFVPLFFTAGATSLVAAFIVFALLKKTPSST